MCDSGHVQGRLIDNVEHDTLGDKVRLKLPVSKEIFLSIMDLDGEISVKALKIGSGTLDIQIFTCRFNIKPNMALDEGIYEITDTFGGATGHRLKLDTDLSLDGVGIWEDCPYSIQALAYTHINGLVTANDTIEPMTTSVETTEGISGHRFIDIAGLDIITQIAMADKAVWWVPLGTLELNYKSTFTDGSPAAMTDADVLSWSGGEFDFEPMFNDYIVYGERTQTSQIKIRTSGFAPDPGDDSQERYHKTKTRIVKQSGLKTHKEALELGRLLVTRDADINLFLSCVIGGWSSYELGDEVSITSTLLGRTAAKYVVTHFYFDMKNYRTVLRLHPRSSDGYVPHLIFSDEFFATQDNVQYIDETRSLWKPIDDYTPE